MIESSIIAWLIFALFIAMASLAGMLLSTLFPWRQSAVDSSLDIAVGLAFAPFIIGLSTIAALYLFPSFDRYIHLGFISLVLILLVSLGYKNNFQTRRVKKNNRYESFFNWIVAALIILWIIALLFNTLFLPLTQNDALEYAIVGREIYTHKNLSVYPLINHLDNNSGFYGPWTHPPLYVSLIYFSSLVQGHSLEPGLMRLIAPWFLICSLICVISLGREKSTRVGLFSGLFFVSTPLLFLGADSSLIDSLPVTGILLIACSFIGLREESKYRSVILGCILGVSLWTHSQSILFILLTVALLAIESGLRHWKQALFNITITLVVSLIVGGSYYLRNYYIFGTPISDTPIIFAMPELDWKSYFSIGRGLDHEVAIIQYGILKGFFSLEAYGYLFWAAFVGIIIYLKKIFQFGFVDLIVNGFSGNVLLDKIIKTQTYIVIIYMFGVLLSVVIGVDFMIRNERYMLILVPFLSFFSAIFFDKLLSFSDKVFRKGDIGLCGDLTFLKLFTLLIILVAHLVLVGVYYRWSSTPMTIAKFDENSVDESSSFEDKLYYFPSFRLIQEMNSHLPLGSIVFSMRPADMYYYKGRMLSYLDPRLVEFYREKNADIAIEFLKGLGVKYIYNVDYGLPPLNNSVLSEILSRPDLTTILLHNGPYQLYEIKDSQKLLVDRLDLSPKKSNWYVTSVLRLGGRKAVNMLKIGWKRIEESRSKSDSVFFHRHYSKVLRSKVVPVNSGFLGVNGVEIFIKSEVSGNGLIRVYIQEYDENGNHVNYDNWLEDKPIRIGEFTLTENNSFNFLRRQVLNRQTKFYRVLFEHVGLSELTIKEVEVSTFRKRKNN